MIPTFTMGRNALDFSPITNGFNQWQQQRNQLANRELQAAQMAEEQRRFGLQNQLAQGRFGLEQQRFGLEQKRASAADAMIPYQLKKMEAEMSMLPLQRQKMEAEVRALGQKDAMNEAIARMISGGQKPPDAPPPMLQPQSFNTQPQEPALIRTADGAPAPKPPAMVQTPAGPMPEDRARAMGFALALGGKGDAGKMLTDSVERGLLGKEGRNEADKKALNTAEGLARLQAIQSRYKPEYQNIESRLGFAWTAAKEKWAGGRVKIDPKNLAELEDFTAFKADALDNVNQYIKEITGAAMTEAEAKRILQGVPNAGEGVFDGDSPSQFKAKMDAVTKRLITANARATYAQRTGKPWQAIGLNEMNGVIQRKTDELQGMYQRQGLQGPELNRAVKSGLKQEFGI